MRTEIVRISKVSFGAFADIDILVVMSKPISIPPIAQSSKEEHMLQECRGFKVRGLRRSSMLAPSVYLRHCTSEPLRLNFSARGTFRISL